METSNFASLPEDCSTRDVARVLGLAVRSVQLMVDRGELQAWKTPGGHRRIARASVEQWLARRGGGAGTGDAASVGVAAGAGAAFTDGAGVGAGVPQGSGRVVVAPSAGVLAQGGAANGIAPAVAAQRVLLIEDSTHFQTLVKLLVAHHFPGVELHVADDGIVGLAMAGALRPEVLLVDILLPGIDGATLVARLRSHPQFQGSHLIVITSLDDAQRGPYEFALAGLPVVHKPRLVQELPALLGNLLHLPALSKP